MIMVGQVGVRVSVVNRVDSGEEIEIDSLDADGAVRLANAILAIIPRVREAESKVSRKEVQAEIEATEKEHKAQLAALNQKLQKAAT